MAFIYVITNDINGKQYVGKTNNSIEERFREHIRDSRKKKCKKRPLYSAINKYGIEHFYVAIIEECSAKDSANREIYWIDKLNTYGRNGYNATKGGDSKKYYDYNTLAQKYKELLNQRLTAEFFGCDVNTIKVACKECDVDIVPSTEQIKRKFSKSVAMCDKNNHDIVLREFNSLTEAANYIKQKKKTNCKHSTIRTHISEVCKGKRKSAAGYYWCFL